MEIKEVVAKQIKNSRGNPTIEISINKQKSSSPSGKSTGKYESKQYQKSLSASIKLINSKSFQKEIKKLEINSFSDLKKVESLIKKKLKILDIKKCGANVLFALESATLKALAKFQNKELFQIINPKAKKLPIPVGNAIGGGLHSEKFKNHPTFQEFLIIPKEKSASKNIKLMNNIYKSLGNLIKSKSKNDEGAWQTKLSDEEVLELFSKFSDKVRIGIDVAASSFYKKGKYIYDEKELTENAQIYYMNTLISRYNIFYLEDPAEETCFKCFSKMRKKNLIVGDDLTATQISRLKRAIRMNSINAMIIKPNQNGSLLELAEIFKICKENKIKTILSHRSGETMDSALADLAVGFGADFIKTGISTKWRESKLKRLIQIEKNL